MSQHTPGSWEVSVVKDGFPPNDRSVIIVRDSGVPITVARRMTEANARLIAKAPKMLALIQRIAQEWPHVTEAMTARALLKEIEE